MSSISSKLRHWRDPATGNEGLTYWCQGCKSAHGIRTKGPGAWQWNGDVERPVFAPSVLTESNELTEAGRADYEAWYAAGCPPRNGQQLESRPVRCHTFVGCNGAQPGEVIFLGDCTHALAGTVQPLPDLPEWMR